MARLTRRRWLTATSGATMVGYATSTLGRARVIGHGVATFQVDVTPPLGHPLLGGGFRRAEKIGDPLYAHGLVFTGDDRPIVLVCVDWCELRNDAYARWREAIAGPVGTTVDRVLVHCVHQHDAPYVDLAAQRILAEAGIAQPMCDPIFHERCVQRVAVAAREALGQARPVTHLVRARTRVEQVASNRRVLKPDGTPYYGRSSTCGDAALREQPEGEIDPWLTSLTFMSGADAVASLRSYAVHPMSPYGRGVVSADFVGAARARYQEQSDGLQVYGTGCAGDVTAGKYNDGADGVREQLADRLFDAMRRADRDFERFAYGGATCRSLPIVLPHWDVPHLREDGLLRTLRDEKLPFMQRAMAALGLSSLRRHADGHHVDLQVIDLGAAQIALFPAESFVSYQLQVQAATPGKFLVPIGFGECSPGYIPTKAAVREGFCEEHGYVWVDDSAEDRIVQGMKRLVLA